MHAERAKFALTDDEVLELARAACIVEDHYSAKRGQHAPMDLEWAKDGLTGELFIVQEIGRASCRERVCT